MLLHAGTHAMSPTGQRGRWGAPCSQMRKERHRICSKPSRPPTVPRCPSLGPGTRHRRYLVICPSPPGRQCAFSKATSTVGFQPSRVLWTTVDATEPVYWIHTNNKRGRAPSREAQHKRGAPHEGAPGEERASWGSSRARSPNGL